MTREDRMYRDHAFAFQDFYNSHFWAHVKKDGTGISHYTKRNDQKAPVKKYTRAQVYAEFIKSL